MAEDRIIRVSVSADDVDKPIQLVLAGRGKPHELPMTREEAWVVSDALRSALGRLDPTATVPGSYEAAVAALRAAHDTIAVLRSRP